MEEMHGAAECMEEQDREGSCNVGMTCYRHNGIEKTLRDCEGDYGGRGGEKTKQGWKEVGEMHLLLSTM